MRSRPITPAPPAFVSSPGVLCFARWSRAARQPAGSQPGKWADHRSDRRVRLVAITGSMSRARSGVPWKRGGPRLAPPAGAVRLMRRLGCSPSALIQAIGRYCLYRRLGSTVVSIRKPGGQDPRGGEHWLPPRGVQRLALPRTWSRQAVKAAPASPGRLLPPLTAGIGAPVGAAMGGASSMAGRAGRLHLPDPPRT
jgi:hypothetical protein